MVCLLLASTRSFFALTVPTAGMIATAVVASAVSIAGARAQRLLAARSAPASSQRGCRDARGVCCASTAPPQAAHAIRAPGICSRARDALVLSVADARPRTCFALDPLGDLVGRVTRLYRDLDEIATELAVASRRSGLRVRDAAGLNARSLTHSASRRTILEVADEHDVSVIVLGARRHPGLGGGWAASPRACRTRRLARADLPQPRGLAWPRASCPLRRAAHRRAVSRADAPRGAGCSTAVRASSCSSRWSRSPRAGSRHSRGGRRERDLGCGDRAACGRARVRGRAHDRHDRHMGVDTIALVAMVGSLALGQELAGIVVGLMFSGGASARGCRPPRARAAS